ncbi:MAG: hypothetical protein ACHQ0J_11070 [Candidatus Dormibacterales bacterium]
MSARAQVPGLLGGEDDEGEFEILTTSLATEDATAPAPLRWYWGVAILIVAAVPRVFYLYFVTGPENAGEGAYGDVWHHWQIAYLTKEIGLTAPDGPRLWDLKGLDYFWGALHPGVMVALFYVTGSTDIVIERWLSLAAGSVVVLLTFVICRRHWGTLVAVAASMFTILLPTSVMNDASGMLEPLGVALVLTGIWAWGRQHSFWAGLAFGIATMARAEAWIFSAGMVAAALLNRVARTRALPLILGFALVMLAYMKTLLDHTGNPIYPVWWNFLANAAGSWESTPVNAVQAGVRPYLGAILIVAAIGLGWSLWKRPAGYMYLAFGFGEWVFVAGMLGFTAYLASWVWWMPITRVFAYSYDFTAVLGVLVLLKLMPRWLGSRMLPVAWVAIACSVLAVQVAWMPIRDVFGSTDFAWQQAVTAGRTLGAMYNQTPGVAGESLNVPDDRPDLTYTMAHYGNVSGQRLVSQLYDPFYYLPSGYTYAAHPDVAGPLLECWLDKTDTAMWAVQATNANYNHFIADNPAWFTYLGDVPSTGWAIWRVQVLAPTSQYCKELSESAPH